MKAIILTASEIRSLEGYLSTNPCTSGCYLNHKGSCEKCPLTKDRESILKKLNLI